MLHVVWLGLSLVALRQVMYFRYVDDVTFSLNGPMTECRYRSSRLLYCRAVQYSLRFVLYDGERQD